jgi:hypothetical protein
MRAELPYVVYVEMVDNIVIYLRHNKRDIRLLVVHMSLLNDRDKLYIYERMVLSCRVIINKDLEGMWSWSNLCVAGSTEES